ncbi:MAG: putative DNA modification/repair radical SAM protein [Elusimicrobia bacterium RIFCSPLOWO2_02_FULL_61_11]|nr:MAG: putative DNA modification/repair radical SAM protein [Elusimicrobia bacterium RIFCSPLOWO2_02_FULL_61_11]
MDLDKKLEILADSAKYDASCASSGSDRGGAGGAGAAHLSGVCHSWAADGRCISLLKILMTNECVYDCAYCVNRRSNDSPKAILTPDEIAGLTFEFYKRNYIEGLFLSSGIIVSPDRTMELMLEAVRKLREQFRFNGYVHMKVIPGADQALIDQAGLWADRVSVNIELPSDKSLRLLAPGKTKTTVLAPMSRLADRISASKDERRSIKSSPAYAPAGQSTQLIIGATPETDREIIKLSEALYDKMRLKRVYYSAFVPIMKDSRLPVLLDPPLLREHRLYQADWLLRFYGFTADELLDEKHPTLDLSFDPKTVWAINNLHLFPLEVNKAPYEELLRVPGIGVTSARRILRARRAGPLSLDDLKKLGVVMKRAVYFVTAGGKYAGLKKESEEAIKIKLLEHKNPNGQLDLFGEKELMKEGLAGTVSGQL